MVWLYWQVRRAFEARQRRNEYMKPFYREYYSVSWQDTQKRAAKWAASR